MLGGVHWLHRPMPQTFRTRLCMRSCGADRYVSWDSRPRNRKNQPRRHHDTHISPFRRLFPLSTYAGNLGIEIHEKQLRQQVVLYPECCITTLADSAIAVQYHRPRCRRMTTEPFEEKARHTMAGTLVPNLRKYVSLTPVRLTIEDWCEARRQIRGPSPVILVQLGPPLQPACSRNSTAIAEAEIQHIRTMHTCPVCPAKVVGRGERPIHQRMHEVDP